MKNGTPLMSTPITPSGVAVGVVATTGVFVILNTQFWFAGMFGFAGHGPIA